MHYLSFEFNVAFWEEGIHLQQEIAIKRSQVQWFPLRLDAQLEVWYSFPWSNACLNRDRRWIRQYLHYNIQQLLQLRQLIDKFEIWLIMKYLMELLRQLFDVFFGLNNLFRTNEHNFSSYHRKFELQCDVALLCIFRSKLCHHWMTLMTLFYRIQELQEIIIFFWRFSYPFLHLLRLL